MRQRIRRYGVNLAVIVGLALMAVLAVQGIAAQEGSTPGDLDFEFNGVVERVEGSTFSIGDFQFDLSGVQLAVPLQPGMTVHVTGALSPGGRITAREVLIVAGSTAAAAAPGPLLSVAPEVAVDCSRGVI